MNILALDFGGTKLAAAFVTGPLVSETQFSEVANDVSEGVSDASTDRDRMLRLCREVLGGAVPQAVGVSFGGLLSHSTGRVIRSHHVRGWEDFPLKEWLENTFHAPVCVENDANAAAFGEWRLGAAKDTEIALYVTVSTGVGGGWIIGGRVYHGRDGLAGEIGHTQILKNGPLCTCGRRGCVESLASGQAIARMAHEACLSSPLLDSTLFALEEENALTAKMVAGEAASGDPVASRILQLAAESLGQGIASAISLVNPDVVVVGGGVMNAGPQYIQHLFSSVYSSLLPGTTTKLALSALGATAPLWGAAALAEASLS